MQTCQRKEKNLFKSNILAHFQAQQHCPHADFLKNSCISKYNIELQVKGTHNTFLSSQE